MSKERKWTEEELDRPITYERFETYHHYVGEDFFDQEGQIVNAEYLLGFICAKRPEIAKELIEVFNESYDSILEMDQFFEDHNLNKKESGFLKTFYELVAEAVNFTEGAKIRVNKALIPIEELVEEDRRRRKEIARHD